MNYLLLMYPRESVEELEGTHQKCVDDCADLVGRLTAEGKYLGAGILEPAELGRRVNASQGARLVTDGPFAETREQFAGFLLIQADSLDEAIAIAMEHPVAHSGDVVVRPIKDVSFLPESDAR